MGNILNRVFDSSGPEGKVRGTPQQIIDKYNQRVRGGAREQHGGARLGQHVAAVVRRRAVDAEADPHPRGPHCRHTGGKKVR